MSTGSNVGRLNGFARSVAVTVEGAKAALLLPLGEAGYSEDGEFIPAETDEDRALIILDQLFGDLVGAMLAACDDHELTAARLLRCVEVQARAFLAGRFDQAGGLSPVAVALLDYQVGHEGLTAAAALGAGAGGVVWYVAGAAEEQGRGD